MVANRCDFGGVQNETAVTSIARLSQYRYCYQGHHSKHFPLNFFVVGFGSRDNRKKLYLTLELPSLTHTSVRYHALRVRSRARAPVPNLTPTNTNTVGCETDINI